MGFKQAEAPERATRLFPTKVAPHPWANSCQASEPSSHSPTALPQPDALQRWGYQRHQGSLRMMGTVVQLNRGVGGRGSGFGKRLQRGTASQLQARPVGLPPAAPGKPRLAQFFFFKGKEGREGLLSAPFTPSSPPPPGALRSMQEATPLRPQAALGAAPGSRSPNLKQPLQAMASGSTTPPASS